MSDLEDADLDDLELEDVLYPAVKSPKNLQMTYSSFVQAHGSRDT
jgi:hypothetical protein